MPSIIDHETIHVDTLPTIWSPVQWDLSPEEKAVELETQATASLLWSANIPETILRLLLAETDITRILEKPDGFDPEIQGEWDDSLLTFSFQRPIELKEVRREVNQIEMVYYLADLGYWEIKISPEKVTIERV